MLLPGDTGHNKGYGRIVSIGPRVEDASLEPGMIGVFDMNGVRVCTLGQHEKEMYVAITEDMLFSTIDESDLKELGLPAPGGLPGEEDSREETPAA